MTVAMPTLAEEIHSMPVSSTCVMYNVILLSLVLHQES